MNLRPSWKKASPLIASVPVLSVKFHYIQLILYGSWLLVGGHHSLIDDFSSHHSIMCVNLSTLIRLFIETGLFINLYSHRWVRLGDIYLGNISTFSFHNFPLLFLRECSFNHMLMHLAICVFHTFYLTHLELYHFITYILGSLLLNVC